MRVRCLSIHADYECRHSGACCRAGWAIPLDDDVRRRMQARSGVKLGIVLETSPCQFFEPETQLCGIHRLFGAEYKPPSCRHFPRVALLDSRGVSLTLSHYCPTAAAMLFREDIPLRIVENPPSFPPHDDYEGFDARHVLPPLLRPGMLSDLEGHSAWEIAAVKLLGRSETTPESALDALASIAIEIERWSPAAGTLREHVARTFGAHDSASPVAAPSRWGDKAPIINRYLAARLFASWVPYRSDRLSAVVHDLAHAHTVLMEQARRADLLAAIRETDLRVVHSATGTGARLT